MKNILNYITYKFNFIKIYFYVNIVPIKILFDFSIKTEIEFFQKCNYYLFSIENAIMDLASIKCSTFYTPTTKYNCHLTNNFGWQ